MKIEIDSGSGFCFGVVSAIRQAEKELKNNNLLYCLGDIVHNSAEVKRLKNIGLVTIDHNEFKSLRNCIVLLRAHGEPPETYKIAKENNIRLIDATCPVVLKLQLRIKIGFQEISKSGGQLVIYGKQGHAEVNGLVGQTQGKAIVVGGLADLDKIDFSKPVTIFSQTTKSIEGFEEVTAEIKRRMIEKCGSENINFTANDTICRQVSNRHNTLIKFSQIHDVIIFVTDMKSSNGKVLFDVCKQENQSTYMVSDVCDLQKSWFINTSSVGICGATSTPRWLMEKIADEIKFMTSEEIKY